VLVEQAGGVVSSYSGAAFALESGRLIACTPDLHAGLVEGLGSCKPLSGASYGAPELDKPAP
jgi:myo-inositol-1(or 4)-monophosphatase